jgi:hypothetical protein
MPSCTTESRKEMEESLRETTAAESWRADDEEEGRERPSVDCLRNTGKTEEEAEEVESS